MVALYKHINPQQAMAILARLLHMEYPDDRATISIITHLLLVICKQENITNQSPRLELTHLGIKVNIIPAFITMLYKHAASIIDVNRCSAMECMDPRIQLVVVQQCSFANLTSFITIGRAIRKDFSWAQVSRLYPVDCDNLLVCL